MAVSLRFSPDDPDSRPTATTPLPRIRFGAFELDATSGELRSTEPANPNQKIVLREQVFQILLMLLERKGAIVTREEIKNRLWVGRNGRGFRPRYQHDDSSSTPVLWGTRPISLGTSRRWRDVAIDSQSRSSTWNRFQEQLWTETESSASTLPRSASMRGRLSDQQN
jgi:hypothetical protein